MSDNAVFTTLGVFLFAIVFGIFIYTARSDEVMHTQTLAAINECVKSGNTPADCRVALDNK